MFGKRKKKEFFVVTSGLGNVGAALKFYTCGKMTDAEAENFIKERGPEIPGLFAFFSCKNFEHMARSEVKLESLGSAAISVVDKTKQVEAVN